MQIKEFMSKNVVTVGEDQSVLEVRNIMAEHNYRRLPVVDDIKRIKGILTAGDVGRATPSDASTLSKYEANYILGKLKIKDLMTKNVVTVSQEDELERAAYLMYQNKFGVLPVVDADNKLCGIVADSDILKVFVDLLGYATSSTKITIDVTDKVGVLAQLGEIFKNRGVNIISVLTREIEGQRKQVMIRADLTNAMDIIQEIRDAGFNIVDISTIKVQK